MSSKPSKDQIPSQKEYLKKYLSKKTGSDGSKHKKKTGSTKSRRVKVVDDDIAISLHVDEDELRMFDIGEDAPQVVDVIDESKRDAPPREYYEDANRWKKISDENNKDPSVQRYIKVEDMSPPRRHRKDKSRQDIPQDSDVRNNRQESPVDISPPRKKAAKKKNMSPEKRIEKKNLDSRSHPKKSKKGERHSTAKYAEHSPHRQHPSPSRKQHSSPKQRPSPEYRHEDLSPPRRRENPKLDLSPSRCPRAASRGEMGHRNGRYASPGREIITPRREDETQRYREPTPTREKMHDSRRRHVSESHHHDDRSNEYHRSGNRNNDYNRSENYKDDRYERTKEIDEHYNREERFSSAQNVPWSGEGVGGDYRKNENPDRSRKGRGDSRRWSPNHASQNQYRRNDFHPDFHNDDLEGRENNSYQNWRSSERRGNRRDDHARTEQRRPYEEVRYNLEDEQYNMPKPIPLMSIPIVEGIVPTGRQPRWGAHPTSKRHRRNHSQNSNFRQHSEDRERYYSPPRIDNTRVERSRSYSIPRDNSKKYLDTRSPSLGRYYQPELRMPDSPRKERGYITPEEYSLDKRERPNYRGHQFVDRDTDAREIITRKRQRAEQLEAPQHPEKIFWNMGGKVKNVEPEDMRLLWSTNWKTRNDIFDKDYYYVRYMTDKEFCTYPPITVAEYDELYNSGAICEEEDILKFYASPTEEKQQSANYYERETSASIARDFNKQESAVPWKMPKTLDGKKSGLQESRNVKLELREISRKETKAFEQIAPELTGRDAQVVSRDRKTGKKRNLEEEEREKEVKDLKENERKEKYRKWGKGTKQVEDAEEKRCQDLREMQKPLARYANDEDLDALLKKRHEGAEDPMHDYMRNKSQKLFAQQGKEVKPRYKGPYAENRFGIPPGAQWDGVDRSNGYEKRWFERQSSLQATKEEAYKWSTSDM